MRDERTGADSQAKVFISYSRKDIEAAERLRDWLAAIRFQVYLDTQDIFPGEPWQDRLARLIEAADTVVFLLSPNSASSEICDWEVGEAERQSKRILAVVIRDVSPSEAPERLRRLNWLFIRNASEERTGGRLLLQALHTDIAWIR